MNVSVFVSFNLKSPEFLIVIGPPVVVPRETSVPMIVPVSSVVSKLMSAAVRVPVICVLPAVCVSDFLSPVAEPMINESVESFPKLTREEVLNV